METLETLASKGTSMAEFEAGLEKLVAKADKDLELKASELPVPAPDPDKLGDGVIDVAPAPAKPEPKPKAHEKDWKAEHDKVYGMYTHVVSDSKRQVAEITTLKSEVETLKAENATLKASPTPAISAFTDADRTALSESLGEEDVARMEKLFGKYIAPVKDALDKANTEIETLRGGVKQTAEDAKSSALRTYLKSLTDAASDSIDVLNSDGFKDWASSETISEFSDETLYQKALEYDYKHDTARVLGILAKYKATLEGGDKEEIKMPSPEPPKGRGPAPLKPAKKTYSSREAEAFLQEYAKLPYGDYAEKAKTPEGQKKLDDIYEDIMAAKKEGRLIGP